jgi:hypothetical protein
VSQLVNVHAEVVAVRDPRATQLIAADVAETVPLAQLMGSVNMRCIEGGLKYREVKVRTVGQHEDVMFVTTELDAITVTRHLNSSVRPVVWPTLRFIGQLEIKFIGTVHIHRITCRSRE